MTPHHPLADRVLALAARHPFTAETAEAGLERVRSLLGPAPGATPDAAPDPAALHGAIAGLVAAGLLKDPVLLSDQSLQCLWRFIPTPEGLAAAVLLPGDA